MTYYPKSQIEENLYTNGGEYKYAKGDKKNNQYIGYYYKISTGEAWTGKTQNDPPNDSLIKLDDGSLLDRALDEDYSQGWTDTQELCYMWDGPILPKDTVNSELNGGKYPLLTNKQNAEEVNIYREIDSSFGGADNLPQDPRQEHPQPTENDYKVGFYTRYFLVKSNEKIFFEVSKETYDKVLKQDASIIWSYYEPIEIKWTLKGGIFEVSNTNRNMIKLWQIRNNKKGLEEYLKREFNLGFIYEGDLNKRFYPTTNELVPKSLPLSYGYSQVRGKHCENCVFFGQGTNIKRCQKFVAIVKPEYWCASWNNVIPQDNNQGPTHQQSSFAPNKSILQAQNTGTPSAPDTSTKYTSDEGNEYDQIRNNDRGGSSGGRSSGGGGGGY